MKQLARAAASVFVLLGLVSHVALATPLHAQGTSQPSGKLDPPRVTAGRDCNSGAAADAIGRKDTPALRAEVTRKVGHSRILWLPPGSIVPSDLRSDRLNIDIDAGGVVTRVRCG